MNWQQWSQTQAEQIVELRAQVRGLRNQLHYAKKRAQLWRKRALEKKEAKR